MYGGRTYVSSRIMCGSVRAGFIFEYPGVITIFVLAFTL